MATFKRLGDNSPLSDQALICFPYAGSGALAFLPWKRHFESETTLWTVIYPGREHRLGEGIPEFLNAIVEEVVNQFPSEIKGEFHFFGHSLGALVAFEVARQLRHRDKKLPSSMIVSGASAPDEKVSRKRMSDLPVNEFKEAIGKLGGLPDGFWDNQELLDIFLPVLRADFRLRENYVYQEESPLPIPIWALGGREDEYSSPESIVAWNSQTSVRFGHHFFNGGHFYFRDSGTDFFRIIKKIISGDFTV